MQESLVEHPADAIGEPLVSDPEAAVVEVIVDEADILPGAVEQDPCEREVRNAQEVLPPDTRRPNASAASHRRGWSGS